MSAAERLGLYLQCEGIGDCLYAIPVIKKLRQKEENRSFDVITHHPKLFEACPYVEDVYSIEDREAQAGYPHKLVKLFELDKLPHWAMDTCDFISIPLGLGQLSFRDKQLEYFPTEKDESEAFDVVLNTSETWPVRTWPQASWQRLADRLREKGLSVAVVGKDTKSGFDGMVKRSPPLEGCRNLVNRLSLDQTFYTLWKCRVFVSCQNGLSVLSGATDAEVVVLDFSIDWSRRAIYRRESPFYKVSYVKGDCTIYCAAPNACPLPENRGEFKCIPGYDKVERAVFARLGLQ